MRTYFGQVVHQRSFDGVRAIEKRHRRGERLPRHQHSQPYATLVLRGQYDEEHGGERTLCRAPALIVHPAGEAHTNHFAYGDAHLIAVEVPTDGAVPDLAARFGRRQLLEGPRAADLARRLQAELRRGDVASAFALRAWIWQLIATLARSDAKSDQLPDWLEAVSMHIEHHWREPSSLTELARRAGVHPSRLTRRFRDAYGMSPFEALRRRRVEAARDLLDTDLTLVEVAQACGFADQSHLTRQFADTFGAPPGAYRRRIRESRSAPLYRSGAR